MSNISSASMQSSSISRRDALAISASLAAAGLISGGSALTSSAVAADDATAATMPIIDCHQHLWDLTKFELSVAQARLADWQKLSADQLCRRSARPRD